MSFNLEEPTSTRGEGRRILAAIVSPPLRCCGGGAAIDPRTQPDYTCRSARFPALLSIPGDGRK